MSGRVYRDNADYGSGGLEEMTINGVITEARLAPFSGLRFKILLLATGEGIMGLVQSDDLIDAVIANFGKPVSISGLVFVDGAGEPMFIEQVDAVEPLRIDLFDVPADFSWLRVSERDY